MDTRAYEILPTDPHRHPIWWKMVSNTTGEAVLEAETLQELLDMVGDQVEALERRAARSPDATVAALVQRRADDLRDVLSRMRGA